MIRKILSAALAGTILFGTSTAAFAGHYVYVKNTRHHHTYPHPAYVVTRYYQPRPVVYVDRYYRPPARVVYVHRSYGPIYYDEHRRQYYRKDSKGNDILLGAVLGAIGLGAVIAATH